MYVAIIEAKSRGCIHKILPQVSVLAVRAVTLRIVYCLKTGLTLFISVSVGHPVLLCGYLLCGERDRVVLTGTLKE